ncbi:MAG TPA: penicillin-binding transpeptidase domain-containing protein [Acidimicrobiales bacterium]|nr:penicillin-binding transpeptidase domain-containing protein [Acidimicrobiales bacterium]
MGRRIRWLGIIMLICFALVLVQLMNIQFRKANALANSPYNPQIAAKKFDNLRGTITLGDGTVLARSVRISSSSGQYNYKREYPQGSLYAGITGYDGTFYGTSGLEYEYNQYLQVHPQPPQTFSQLLFNKPPSVPDNVTITIDPVLQKAAYNALTTLPPGQDKDGAVVVLNPSTGAVLAMVSNPTFDPNQVSDPSVAKQEASYFVYKIKDHEGFRPIQPIATEERFFPGSTFKVVTSTAVYNLKPSLINYSFPPALSISFPDSNKTLSNDSGACGGSMVEMLPASCDPGYGELGIQIGVPTLTKQAQLFGYTIFGAPTQYVPNIDLPAVIPSTFSNLSPNSQADLAYSAIGQFNDSATALGNALVAAGIANGGTIMTPHVMSRITDHQGGTIKTYTPIPMLRAASTSAATSVTSLMQSVAQYGTAAGVFPSSWDVAVKTGTAQVQAPSVAEQTDDWMIGFMPAKSPQIAIAVVVPYQQKDDTGAIVAGPIVRAVFQAWLNESAGQ